MLSRLASFSGVRNRIAKSVPFGTFLFSLATLLPFAVPVSGHGQTTAVSFEDAAINQQDLFYRGTDQHIYFRYWNSITGWRAQDATALSGAVVAAAGSSVTAFKDASTNDEHVIFEGANQHLYDLYSTTSSGVWNVQDVSGTLGGGVALANSPLTSFYDALNQVRLVFFLDTNLHVNVLYWKQGWLQEDLTNMTGAPAAAANSSLTSFKDDNGNFQHLFYEAADQHVHELYTRSDPGQIYTTDNTASAGAALAASGSPLTSYFDPVQNQQNVFYIGTDGLVRRLSFVTLWQTENLNALAPAVSAMSGSALSSYLDTRTDQGHVLYLGVDQHLHQFYRAGIWLQDDITVDGLSPLPSQTTSITAFKDDPDNQQHVFFTGTSGQLYHTYYGSVWLYENITNGVVAPSAQKR